LPSATSDNDGYPDLRHWIRSRHLYHNNHDGTFTDVTAKAGVADEGGCHQRRLFDYDKDGWLDLVVTNYIEWSSKIIFIAANTVPAIALTAIRKLQGQKTKLYTTITTARSPT